MINIKKSCRYLVFSVGSGLALFASLGLLIEESHSGNLDYFQQSGVNDRRNWEFENTLKALHEGDSYNRHRAAIALGRSGNPEAVDPLIEALNDADVFVRSFASAALGNLGDRRAVAPLIKALGDESFIVRRAAAAALGSVKDPSAVDPLIKALNDGSYLIRRSAAEALGHLGDPRAVDPLIGALSDEDDYIWNGALKALTTIGNAGVPKLVNNLGDWVLGPRVAEILSSLNWQPVSDQEIVRFDTAKRKKQALLQNWETVKKVLLSDMNHGNNRQVENAVYALIEIGREEMLDALVTIMRTKGTVEMVAAFLESGNDQLSKTARGWAMENKIEIKAESNSRNIRWGGMESL